MAGKCMPTRGGRSAWNGVVIAIVFLRYLLGRQSAPQSQWGQSKSREKQPHNKCTNGTNLCQM